MKEGGGEGRKPYPLPALLLAPLFSQSLTLDPRSFLLNGTETLATQATCKRTQQLPTLLRQECCVRVAVVSKRMQELPPTRDNMQQGVQTDATCNIQQCWELLANNVTLFARGFKMIKSYSQRKSMVLDVVIFSNFVQ